MAYRDDIIALSPDHFWRLDGVLTADVGGLTVTNSGFSLTASPTCEDSVNAAQCNAVGDRLAVASDAAIDGALSQKMVAGWIRLSAIQLPPKSIYREGTVGNQFNLVMWAGNVLMLDIVNGATVLQAFSDRVFRPGRNYHVAAIFEGDAAGNKFSLYVDGIEQSVKLPGSGLPGFASIGSRSAAEWGDPSGSTEVGANTVLLNGAVNCNYGFWATFSGANVPTAEAEIRATLFEKGAIPEVTITDQAGLDALADTVRSDSPLAIRVDVAGSITLTADNVTFDPLASIHVQYTGTGTLTWVNTNGADASIGSTPGGGTIDFITPSVITVEPLVADSEVRIYDSATGTEVAGIESSGLLFQSSISVNSVDVVVHKEDYVYIRVDNVDMSLGDVSLPIEQVFDRNYENP